MGLLAMATGPIVGWIGTAMVDFAFFMFVHKRHRLQTEAMIVTATVFLSNFIFWFKDPQLGTGATAVLSFVFLIFIIYLINVDIQQVLYLFTE